MSEFPASLSDIQLRRELIDQGYTDRDLRHMVRTGILAKVRYGAYVDATLTAGLDATGWMRLRARAVLRTAHPSAVLSHQTALAEHGVPLWGADLTQVHLTRTDSRSGRREAGIVHHRLVLPDGDVTSRQGLPLTTPARATLEVVTAESSETGLVAACGVLHANLATSDDLQAVWLRATRWPGALGSRLVLPRADARIESVGEARTWHLFFAHQIPLPEPQVMVHTPAGALLGIVDFLWRDRGVFLEFDGREKYAKFRRPGESLEAYVRREKLREEAICAATGWVCIRISWADLARPRDTSVRIRRLLESRRSHVA